MHISTVAALLVAAAPALADVIIVEDTQPGVTIPADATLAVAVANASSGDTLLIGPGSFEVAPVIDKALTLEALDPDNPPSIGALFVQDLPSGATVVLRNLEIGTTQGFTTVLATPSPITLEILNCDGAVHIEDSLVLGESGFGGIGANDGEPGITVSASSDVYINRSIVRGGAGRNQLTFLTLPAPGILADDSTITCADVTISGGDATLASHFFADAPGGSPAIDTTDGTFVVLGCALSGGAGANASNNQPGPGGPGGDGILALGTASVFVRNALFTPGDGGFDDTGTTQAVGGFAVESGPNASLTFFPTSWRGFSASSPVFEGDAQTFKFNAPTADTVFLWIGLDGGQTVIPKFEGTLFTPNPLLAPFVLIPALTPGFSEVDIVVPPFLGALDAVNISAQAFYLDPEGDVTLSATSRYVIVNEAFAP